MSDANPIDLLFGGMEKLGPGSNFDTIKVLDMVPRAIDGVVIDAGCGAGRHTLVLAKRLQTLVHAVDSYKPFLASLTQRAKQAGLENLVQVHCMDMACIPSVFHEIDLLWSEGAAYYIGFPHALKTWRSALKASAFAVVSELSWLRGNAPVEVQQFFQSGYPDMRSVDENRALAEDAGYRIVTTHAIPRAAWVEGYYDILEPRAKALLDHPDKAVSDFAAETIEEIRIFDCSDDSYAYVFYVMQSA